MLKTLPISYMLLSSAQKVTHLIMLNNSMPTTTAIMLQFIHSLIIFHDYISLM